MKCFTRTRFVVLMLGCAIALAGFQNVVSAESFSNKNGAITVSDLGSWKVIQDVETERQNGVLVRIDTTEKSDCSVRVEIFDVNYFDVFDKDVLSNFRKSLRQAGNQILTIKPVELGGRKYQGIFCVKLVTTTEKPTNVFIMQLMLVDGNRFHNITIASDQDEPETNPEIQQLLENLTIK